jgi:aldehyde:ferredoxin oxidoreductase
MTSPTLFGYHGCYLRVDVSLGSAERVPLTETVLRQFLGGSGLGAWLLLAEGGACVDALAADAPLAFVFSPLVGSPLTTSAKFAVVSKSPLTDRINDSLASSGFAIAGKRCGCDAIVIVDGRQSSTLIIDDGRVRLEPAEDLRGTACHVAETALKTRLGSDYQVASIGPAGEHRTLCDDPHDGRHAGRGGSGAVLGSKNLKAIAVRGTVRCEWAHPRELTEYSKALSKRSFGPATAKYRELGTAANLLTFNRLGVLPTRNFRSGTFAEAVSLSPEEIRQTHSRTRASCVACTIGCEHIYSLGDEKASAWDESPFALGPLCGVAMRMSCSVRPGCATTWDRHDQRGRHNRLRHGVRGTRMARRAMALVRIRRGDSARHRIDRLPRRCGESAGGGQSPRRPHGRTSQHRVRSAGQGSGDSRLRAARAADDGPRLRGGRSWCRP